MHLYGCVHSPFTFPLGRCSQNACLFAPYSQDEVSLVHFAWMLGLQLFANEEPETSCAFVSLPLFFCKGCPSKWAGNHFRITSTLAKVQVHRRPFWLLWFKHGRFLVCLVVFSHLPGKPIDFQPKRTPVYRLLPGRTRLGLVRSSAFEVRFPRLRAGGLLLGLPPLRRAGGFSYGGVRGGKRPQSSRADMAMGQNPNPHYRLKWGVHLPQNGTIGVDPQPYVPSWFSRTPLGPL